jgi:ATP-dependent Lon protease
VTQINSTQAIDKLKSSSSSVKLPQSLSQKIDDLIEELVLSSQSDQFWQKHQQTKKYIDWVTDLPWYNSSQDILDTKFAREKLDYNHHGLDQVKQRLLEYVSILALQKTRHPDQKIRAPILLFVGLVGTGKTTMAVSISEMLGRKLIRIPFGGLGDPLYLRGQSRVYSEAEPGQIIKGLVQSKTNNPVILLDEIDRVADEAINTIMGVLVELLDPEQNDRFTDHYIDYPFDLSQAIFCATCNNTKRIATAVLDRLEVIEMPSYTDDEKQVIGQKYILPKVISDAGLSPEEVKIDSSVWPSIIRPLGFDAGVRTLKRNLEMLVRKSARLIFEGQSRQVVINADNVKHFIPQW